MTEKKPSLRTILIVDDETEAASAVARYFRRERGWSAIVAHRGDEALERAETTPPDVAILDIRMPGMDGIELLKRLKERFPRCVVVMLTAVDDATTATRALKEGATDYVRKPLILLDLEHTVDSALEKEELRHENIDYQLNLEKKVDEQTHRLRSLNKDLEKANLDIAAALTFAIEAKDEYTRGHSQRVTDYAMALGDAAQVGNAKMKTLELGSLLHDVGKIGVSDHILHAPRKLSDDEFDQVRRHPVIGEKIVGHIEFLAEARLIIRHHHERFDGRGYPDGLAGEKIDLLARIAGVADIFDALTSDRPYRTAYGIETALEMMREIAGTHLDPRLVDLFITQKLYLVETVDG